MHPATPGRSTLIQTPSGRTPRPTPSSNRTHPPIPTVYPAPTSSVKSPWGGVQGEFDPETRFAVTWFEQHGTESGDFGTANSIATARGVSVENVQHAGIVEAVAGRVRIRKRGEIDPGWDPATDTHLTVWECCQHLIRTLENEGEHAAAVLLKKIGPVQADAAKDLAYCLYDICTNKRRDAAEAVSYNGLIAVWAELTRQAATIQDVRGDLQHALDL